MKLFAFVLTVISMLCAAGTSQAGVPQGLDRLQDGIYINGSEAGSACVVILKQAPAWLNQDRYTLEVARQASWMSEPDSGDYVLMRAASDVFSLEEMKRQVLEKNGEFQLMTSKTAFGTSKISGKVYEESGHVFWDVNVSSNTCVGLCTGTSSSCTVRID